MYILTVSEILFSLKMAATVGDYGASGGDNIPALKPLEIDDYSAEHGVKTSNLERYYLFD